MNELTKTSSLADLQAISRAIAESKLFPQWNTAEKVLTLMLLCKAEGRDPLSAMSRYDYINGRVAKRANAMLEDFVLSGGKVEWLKTDEKEARAKFYPPGGCPLEHAVTWAEIVRADLHAKENYKKYPAQMLRARLISSALRMCYPTATGQLYVPEELSDLEENKPTPTPTPPPAVLFAPTAKETAKNSAIDVSAVNIGDAVESVAAELITESRLAGLPQDKLCGYLKSIRWIKKDISELSEKQKKTIEEKFEAFAEKVKNFTVEENQ